MSENDQTAAGLPVNSDPAEEKQVETPTEEGQVGSEGYVPEPETQVEENAPETPTADSSADQPETDANPS